MARPQSTSDEDEATSSSGSERPTILPQTPTNHKKQQDDDDDDEDDDEEDTKHQNEEDEDEDEDEEDESLDEDDESNKKLPLLPKPPSDSSDEDSESESEPAKLVTPISSRPMPEEPPVRKRAKSAILASNGSILNGEMRGLEEDEWEEEFPMLKEAVAKLGNGFGIEEVLKRIGTEKARVFERKMLRQKAMETRHQLMKMELLEKSMKLVAEGIERAMESSDD